MPAKSGCRVVISGLGVVAPNGVGKNSFWQNLLAGKSFIDYISTFDASPYPCEVAGEVRDFVPDDFMRRRSVRELWRFAQFALAASRMALDDANLRVTPG